MFLEICHEKTALGPERGGWGELAVYMFVSDVRLKQVHEVWMKVKILGPGKLACGW